MAQEPGGDHVFQNEMTRWISEPLHPDLVPYLRDLELDGNRVRILHHPLVVTLFPVPDAVNRQYEHKLERLRQLTEAGDYVKQVFYYERPYRLEKLVAFAADGLLDTDGLREILPSTWTDMESGDTLSDPWIPEVLELFRQTGFLSDSGRSQPASPVRVYRGGEPDGLAWSRERQVAEWFARRFESEKIPAEPLYRAEAPPEAVLAMFDSMSEAEVVVDPRLLTRVTKIAGPPYGPSAGRG